MTVPQHHQPIKCKRESPLLSSPARSNTAEENAIPALLMQQLAIPAVPSHGGTPRAGWLVWENMGKSQSNIDDLGLRLFQEHRIYDPFLLPGMLLPFTREHM